MEYLYPIQGCGHLCLDTAFVFLTPRFNERRMIEFWFFIFWLITDETTIRGGNTRRADQSDTNTGVGVCSRSIY